MDPQAVRDRANVFCDALRSGDMERASESMSRELRSNLGPFVAILPLPLTAAVVESVEVAGSGHVATLRLTGDEGEILLQTRWKEREGEPTIVEASHVIEAPPTPLEPEAEAEA